MKKIFLLLGMSIFTIISFVHAQENAQRSGDVLTLTPNINATSISKINNIGLKFCNEGVENNTMTSTLHIQLQPGARSTICTFFYNRATDDTKVAVGFTVGSLTKDGALTCETDSANNDFARLIGSNENNSFVLSGNGQTVKNFKITVPTTATGHIQGCLSFYLPDSYSKNTGDVFGIVIRKVANIQITVTGAVYNFGRRDDYKELYTTNKSGILKIIIAILGLWLIMTVIKTSKKKTHGHSKEKHHQKK